MKAIGYLRVSTTHQNEEYGIDAQKEAILSYAHLHGITIVEWVKDVCSGALEHKPALDSLIYGVDVKKPPYDAIVVFKCDRISRDMFQLCYTILELQRKGLQVISTKEDILTETPEGKVMLSLIGYCAEKERENIKIRTSNGRQQKARLGGYSGGACPYGYNIVRGRLVASPNESPVVKMIFEMRNKQKMSFWAIADYLNDSGIKTKRSGKWYAKSIQNIVSLEMLYRGYYRYGNQKEWIKGEQEVILDD